MPPRPLYRLFPLAARLSRWLEQRFAPSGRLLLAVLLSAAILGIDIGQTLAYQLAVLAFALLASGFISSWRWRPRLTVRRVLPNMVTAGLASHYWLEITNHGAAIESDLMVQDNLVQPPLSLPRFTALRDLEAAGRSNWFDRAVGFPRWVSLRRRERGAEIVMTPIPTIAPGATVRVRIELTALRRGWLRYASVRVLRPEPLGLCRARFTLALSDQLLALPRRHPLPRIRMRSERRYQPGGLSLAHAVGDSQEFAALRDYQPGDPRRHIHWRSFAKTGALIVKQYQDEFFDRHALVVDTYASGTPRCFEAVIEVAASVVGGTRPQDSILDLVIAGSDVLELNAGRGLGDSLRALTYLAESCATRDDDFTALAAMLRGRMARLASVILVFGHYDDARRALIDELRAHDLPVLALLVVAESATAINSEDARAVGLHRLRIEHLGADLAAVDGAP
jgi:uncharacterized protein (DUF58 family)